ncbi:hypothetical protein BX591_101354 [Paraburkholderia bryophila]|uniref:Uncharacterized protein n=1 Tax=Paraburkholderia bryophila TaxID=420952 RepID=A0A329D3Y0_9BURK|nr:hypothetical protein BX591_101354 [Paraburkholderia bryophila]
MVATVLETFGARRRENAAVRHSQTTGNPTSRFAGHVPRTAGGNLASRTATPTRANYAARHTAWSSAS